VRRTTCLLTALLGTLTACSGDDVDVVTTAVSMPAQAPPTTTIATDATVTALSRLSLSVFAGTADGSHLVAGSVLDSVEVVPLDGEPATTGAVFASTRVDEELLLVASGGLYQSLGERLVQSEASAALAGLSVSAVASDGDRLWLSASDGLYELAGTSLRRWDLGGPVSAVATNGTTVLAAAERDDRDAIHMIVGEDQTELDVDFGRVHQIVAGTQGELLLATDTGLVVHQADGAMTRYSLSADEAGVAVLAIDVEPYAGVFASTDIGVVELATHGPIGVAGEPRGGSLAVDRQGDVWLGGEASLTGLFVGVPVSFADEVAPILTAACTQGCHLPGGGEIPAIDFTNYDVAATYAGRIVDRVIDGASPMPPTSATPLGEAELDLLLRWVTSGTAP
jgi:hypothetical protein